MQEGYESFTPEQEALIHHYVTNTRSSIFALRNLPEVVEEHVFAVFSLHVGIALSAAQRVYYKSRNSLPRDCHRVSG